MSKTKRVRAIALGIWDGSRRRPGDEFTVPVETKGSWFVDAADYKPEPTQEPAEPTTMSEMNKRRGSKDVI